MRHASPSFFLLIAILCAVLLTSCSFGVTPLPAGVEKLASFTEKSELPLLMLHSSGAYSAILGEFGKPGGAIAIGDTPDSLTTVHQISEDASASSLVSVNGTLFWIESYTDRMLLNFYQEASGVSTITTLKAGQCKQLACLGDKLYYIDANENALFSVDTTVDPLSPALLVELADGTPQCLAASKDSLAYVIATPEGRVLYQYTPASGVKLSYTLPDHISFVYAMDFLPEYGTYAFYYNDAITHIDSIGTWYAKTEQVISYFNFSEQIRCAEPKLYLRNDKLYWITAASLSGRELDHYRIVAMDQITHEPDEYMRAFSFTFDGSDLLYLGFDSNNRTDRISLYRHAAVTP